MTEPTPFQLATILLVGTFQKYAGADGNPDTLTKAEFKTLLESEMPELCQVTKGNDKFDKMMEDLDQNNDQEIDIMEYMTLVTCMTMCTSECLKMCKE